MSSREKTTIAWLALGTLLMAVIIGLAAGMSETAVVAALLPLLFTVIGAAGGFHLVRADLSDARVIRRLRYIGMLSAVFAIGVGMGALSGIILRSCVVLGSTSLGLQGDPENPVTEELDIYIALELGMLRHRMTALGFQQFEQELVLTRARESLEQRSTGKQHLKALRDVVVAANAVRDAAASIGQGAEYSERERNLASEIWSAADVIASDLGAFADYLKAGESFHPKNLSQAIRETSRAIRGMENRLEPRGSSSDLAGKYIDLRDALLLRQAVRDLRYRWLDLSESDVRSYRQIWMTDASFIKSLDKYLAETKVPAPEGQEKRLSFTTP